MAGSLTELPELGSKNLRCFVSRRAPQVEWRVEEHRHHLLDQRNNRTNCGARSPGTLGERAR